MHFVVKLRKVLIVCLQETTKCETFDPIYLKNCCARYLDTFSLFPSIWSSGGLLLIWNSSILDGITIIFNPMPTP